MSQRDSKHRPTGVPITGHLRSGKSGTAMRAGKSHLKPILTHVTL